MVNNGYRGWTSKLDSTLKLNVFQKFVVLLPLKLDEYLVVLEEITGVLKKV